MDRSSATRVENLAGKVLSAAKQWTDEDLLLLRLGVEREMRRRRLAFSVGEVGERLAIQFFKNTPRLPKLQLAPPGTKNVDALSRSGERYSIKTVCSAKKTGTVYPDPENREKQLFEYLLLVKLRDDWSLRAIFEFSWETFVKLRSWDKRMNAWYLGCAASTLRAARRIYEAGSLPEENP